MAWIVIHDLEVIHFDIFKEAKDYVNEEMMGYASLDKSDDGFKELVKDNIILAKVKKIKYIEEDFPKTNKIYGLDHIVDWEFE